MAWKDETRQLVRYSVTGLRSVLDDLQDLGLCYVSCLCNHFELLK